MKRIFGSKIASLMLGLAIVFGVSTVAFEQSKVLVMADVAETDGLIVAQDFKSGKEGFLNIKGDVVIPYQFDGAGDFSEGLAAVEKDEKCGYINTSGEVVIPYQFDRVSAFSGGLAMVKKDGKFGYINAKGDVVIPYQFDDVFMFSEGLALVEKEGKWGYINTSGEAVIPYQFDYAGSFFEGLALVEKKGKYGYINTSGEVVIPYQFGDAWNFSEGLAKVKKNGKYGYINTSGGLVIPYQFGDSGYFVEGLARVCKDEKWGFINANGDVVIPYQFDYAYSFSEDLAPVYKNKRWGYINTKGNLVIPYQFDRALSFSDGKALVDKDGKWGYINPKGEFFEDLSVLLKSAYDSSQENTTQVTPTQTFGNDEVTIKFGANTDTSEYNVVVTPVTKTDSSEYNQLVTYNNINEDLISKTLININVNDNGNAIYTLSNGVTLVFDLSDLDLKNIDTSKLICIFINKDTNKIEYIGGRYDANKKSFTTETKNINGNFAVVYGNTDAYNQAILTPNDTNFLSNGTIKILDIVPVNINGTIYVPVRAIFETLGADVSFETTTKTAIISLDGKTVKFRNGESIDGTPAPIIMNSRMLVPVRYVSEAIGANVIWYPEDKVIQITK